MAAKVTAILFLVALTALAAKPCVAHQVDDSVDTDALVRTHLSQLGHLDASTSEGTVDEYVSVYKQILHEFIHNTASPLYTELAHPANISGRHAQRLSDLVERAWCQRTNACKDSRTRKLLDIGDKVVILPAKSTAILAWAAAATIAGNSIGASQATKYAIFDPKWANCIIDSVKAKYVYRPAPSTGAYVYPLKNMTGGNDSVIIAILGDFGTGQPRSVDMLSKIVTGFNPDVVMHLGDTYYSGTADEQTNRQYSPAKSQLKSGMQYYTIPGNHDYFAGGQAFYDTVDKLRQDGMTQQEGSFFALEGPSWLFIGLDTGRADNNPQHVDTAMPDLDDNQLQWLQDKLGRAKEAGKRVILNSHHQLFTQCSAVGKDSEGRNPAVNSKLYAQLSPYLSSLDIWFWGHEHLIQAFQPYVGLNRGRLVGASGILMMDATKPYEPNKDLAIPAGEEDLPQPIPGSPRSGLVSFSYFLKHSFAIMTLQGTSAKVDYYEQDWDCWMSKACQWGELTLVWTESF